MRVVWTIGHGARPSDELVEKLIEHGIDRVVDVRTKPYSRWHSQYNRNALAQTLADHDINYDWRGSSMGGLSPNIGYGHALLWLYDLAESERIALLCSETQPEKCHRKTVIAPDLERLGAVLNHITFTVEKPPALDL